MPDEKQKNPWKAIALSHAFYGAGQIYNQSYFKAICLLLLALSFASLSALSFFHPTFPLWPGLFCFPLLLLVYLFNILDAFFDCKRKIIQRDGSYQKIKKNPWLAIFLNCFFPSLGFLYLKKILLGLAYSSGLLIYVFLGLKYKNNLKVELFSLVLQVLSIAHIYLKSFPHFYGIKNFLFLIILSSLIPLYPSLKYETFFIPSESMLPTLEVNDYLIAKRTNTFNRGDIVIFHPPHKDDTAYVKRLVGLPGDDIQIGQNQIKVNGKPAPFYPPSLSVENLGPELNLKLKDDEVFLLGDNLGNSSDSRVFGPVKINRLFARPFKRYWPWKRRGRLNEVHNHPLGISPSRP